MPPSFPADWLQDKYSDRKKSIIESPQEDKMNILIAAAENDALPGGKVGGLGDVIRDIPPAIAKKGCRVKVIIPSYGFLHKQDSKWIGSVHFFFGGKNQSAEIYMVRGKISQSDVKHFVVDHPIFIAPGNAQANRTFYSYDPPERPFATDASKYALFCTAVAEAITKSIFGPIDCMHLHDWHTAFILILRQFHENYLALKKIRTVYSIHNLSMQGIRPFKDSDSSLESWYPGLNYRWSDLADPRWPNCINPMAAAIRLADVVHTVSPSYAEEIQKTSDKPRFYGAEGLENDIRSTWDEGRLFGILNGCEYPDRTIAHRLNFSDLLQLLKSNLINWAGHQQTVSASVFVAYARLTELIAKSERPNVFVTSVCRLSDQKIFLMHQAGSTLESGLVGILDGLGTQGLYVLLGTGDKKFEIFLTEISSRFSNFIFLNGYSDDCADALYSNGDLFLMPSSFEPCGISQMLAMRNGQPCLVHEVGGLKDTVTNGITGFTFKGKTVENQVDNFVGSFLNALEIRRNHPKQWRQICKNASAARFLWRDTVNRYFEKLYRIQCNSEK